MPFPNPICASHELESHLSVSLKCLMPSRDCPNCAKPGTFLPRVSKTADVEYYSCDHCGHVWRFDKSGPDGPRDVTVRYGRAVIK